MNKRKIWIGVFVAVIAIYSIVAYTNHRNGIPLVKENNIVTKIDSVIVLSDSLEKQKVSDTLKK